MHTHPDKEPVSLSGEQAILDAAATQRDATRTFLVVRDQFLTMAHRLDPLLRPASVAVVGALDRLELYGVMGLIWLGQLACSLSVF